MQPPFVMDKWIVGIHRNQKVDYTVSYEVIHCGRWFKKQTHTFKIEPLIS